MRTVVKKFGGTSVGSVDLIRNCANIVKEETKDTKVVVVVSAMAGVTNKLVEQAHSFAGDIIAKDMIIATGEQISAGLFAAALRELGLKSIPLCGWQVPIVVEEQKVVLVEVEKIIKLLGDGYIPVITGFQGIDCNGNIALLSRGGSDTSAVAVAAALKAECDIYTDVDGVYQFDPNMQSNTENRKYIEIDYTEMLKLSRNGAKVIHPDAVSIAMHSGTIINVLSSFERNVGTIISGNRIVRMDDSW